MTNVGALIFGSWSRRSNVVKISSLKSFSASALMT